jgi:molybdopterin/thiamine biosynthesis adenylyltransferase
MPLDVSRHQTIFSPASWGDKRVDVIGAGATGSAVVLELAKLGVRNLHVWDFDQVEEHNLANQFFGPGDVGRPKVEALADLVRTQTGAEIGAHNAAVTKDNAPDSAVALLLTDTMESRKDIGQAYKRKFRTKALIETRMGTETGYVFTFKPIVPSEMKAWAETLWEDAVTETSACGTAITVGPTAHLLANLAVWQFLRIAADEPVDNQIFFCLRPYLLQTSNFAQAAA